MTNMQYKTNWRLFFSLLIACVLSSLMVLPYAVSLSPVLADNFGLVLVLAAVGQAAVVFSVSIYLGLRLAKLTGLPGAPFLEAALRGEKTGRSLKSVLGSAISLGVLSGVLVILLSLLFQELSAEFLQAEISVGVWKGFLASFYGGIAEEVVFRLFLLALLVWILFKIRRPVNNRPGSGLIWLSIIISAVLFGLGHLGITSDLTVITPVVVARAVLLNGIPGAIFGWLYWQRGLESAIIAHFSADIVLHVITPLVASLFL